MIIRNERTLLGGTRVTAGTRWTVVAGSVSLPTAALAALLLASGCSGMSGRDKNTAVGAGAGAVAGAVLTGGSAVGTVGGAAVGGLIGNQVEKDKK